jgi:hypothetical protein
MPLLSPIGATRPAHLVLLDFITRILLGEEYRTAELQCLTGNTLALYTSRRHMREEKVMVTL